MRIFVFLLCYVVAEAMPSHPVVMAGDVSFSAAEGLISVQCSDASIIHWNDFSIAAQETARFVQPSSLSSVLNRVTGDLPSDIFGRLESNGRVLLINPHGILISKDAVIDTGSFLAAAFDLSDRDFLEGRFSGDGGNAIVVQGHVSARFGDVTLLGQMINIEGMIDATEQLAAIGSKETLVTGQLKAPRVELLGEVVRLENEGSIDVTPGGKAFLGGGYQGERLSADNSQVTFLGPETTINASGDRVGNGGEVIVWSDGQTGFYGKIFARGGEEEGDGGFIEVSGKKALSFSGEVSTLAPHGKVGMLLLDPSDIDIVANGGVDMFIPACPTYAGTAASCILDNGNLATCLNGSSVTITTVSGFVAPFGGRVRFLDDVQWTGVLTSLTVTATTTLEVYASVRNTVGGGAFFGTAGGDILVGPPTGLQVAEILVGGTLMLTSTGGSCILQAGGGTIAGYSSLVQGFDVTINAFQDLKLLGGDGTLGTNNAFLTAQGTGIFNAGGEILVQAGIGTPSMGAAAEIGVVLGTILNCGGNFSHIGFTGSESKATSGFGSPSTFNVGGDFIIRGGTGDKSLAQIVVGGTALDTFDIAGDAIIEGGSSPNPLTNTYATLLKFGTEPLNFFVGGNLLIQGGTGTGVPTTDYASIMGSGGGGLLNIEVLGNVLMQEGSAGTGKDALLDMQLSPLDLFCGGTMTMLSGASGRAAITNGGAPYTINVVGDLVQTGVAAPSDSPINNNTFGTAPITIDVGGNHLLTDAMISSNGMMTINVGQNFVAFTSATVGAIAGVTGTMAGADIFIRARDQVQISGSGPLNRSQIIPFNNGTVIAGNDFIAGNFSEIRSNSGGVISLVCDDDFPTPPGIGLGGFFILPNALIGNTTGGSVDTVRIFTARRIQNSINAPINGGLFVPGPYLVDTDQERWGIWYFNSYYFAPFVIFYKESSTQVYVALTPYSDFAEFFRQLHPYDEYIRLVLEFRTYYEKRSPSPEGSMDSFDLFVEDDFLIRQRSDPRNDIDTRLDPADYLRRGLLFP